MFPAFSQVQREPARLRRGYLLVTQLTAIVAAPAMGTLAVVAPHLVPVLYGSEWTGVVLPLQILCLAGYFRAQYHLGGILSQSAGRVYSELGRQVVYAALVIGGTLIGSSHGLPGVAVAVSVAIMYMFVATGQLALQITDTPWHVYLRAQAGAIVTAAVTCGVALLVRRALEASQASSAVIAPAVIIAAAVPWGVGALWILAHADYELLRARLPGWFAGLVETLRASSWSSSRRASLP
jgi:O-antigen/teichoic acid export membrane protein